MRRARDFLLTFALLAAGGGVVSCDSESSGPTSPAEYIEPSSATVRLGAPVQFRANSSQRVRSWTVLEGSGHGIISERGLYRAPFIRPSSPGATVVAEFWGFTATASVEFETSPPDPLDCCGPGQSQLPEPNEFVYVDELPEPLLRVAPIYPDIAREAGVEGTVQLQALVCSSGQIFDVRVQKSIPMLDGAAATAVRQWVFSPAKANRQPVAVWVVIPVRFSLHEPSSAPVSVLTVPRATLLGRSAGR